MSRADRRVYSIPAGTGFLDALAEGVLAETAGDPFRQQLVRRGAVAERDRCRAHRQ